MITAALIAWVVTALGGFILLARWATAGGVKQMRDGRTSFTAVKSLGHPLLAAAGLVLWVAFIVTGSATLAWISFLLLVPVALLGFAMFVPWIKGRSQKQPVAASDLPAEQSLSPALVYGHGVLAVTTVVLVLLGTLSAGAST